MLLPAVLLTRLMRMCSPGDQVPGENDDDDDDDNDDNDDDDDDDDDSCANPPGSVVSIQSFTMKSIYHIAHHTPD